MDWPMERGSRRRAVLSAVVVVDLILAVFAWRDLASRTDDAVRGTKRMWRWPSSPIREMRWPTG